MGNFVSGLSMTAEQALKGADLRGKVIVVTGGTSGIGLETVRVLALGGATVVVGARRPDKAQAAIDGIREQAGAKPDIQVLPLELASLRSVHAFADAVIRDFQRVDCLVLNAAVMSTPQWCTREGFEYQTGVNFLAHAELTKRLLQGLMLGQDHPSRIVAVTCKLPLQSPQALQWRDLNFRTRPYSSQAAYAQSKIALAVWAQALGSRLEKTLVGVYTVHPGVAVTRLNRHLPFFSVIYDRLVAPFVKTVQQAAATSVHCACDAGAWETGHGQFFDNCRPAPPPPVLNNATLAGRVWAKADELLAGAALDSHELVDYNFGRQVFDRFHELFLRPLARQLGWAAAEPAKQA